MLHARQTTTNQNTLAQAAVLLSPIYMLTDNISVVPCNLQTIQDTVDCFVCDFQVTFGSTDYFFNSFSH